VPWIQTRPPWAVESPGPIARRHLWMSRLTRALIERATIGINTFPSGHAAVSVAIALVVAGPLPVPGALLLALAVMIIAGAVLGRYHYTADVVAGTAVALAAWGIARLMP
jgi:membrane-associated phospholipid phosphatase